MSMHVTRLYPLAWNRLVALTIKAARLCLVLSGLFGSAPGRADEPFIDPRTTVLVHGDPTKEPKYIENAIKAVGISGWGGPFWLDSTVNDELPSGSIYLERAAVHLGEDPLARASIALRVVFRSSGLASSMVARMERRGLYTFYVGPGGYIYPTLISDTTAPALCGALRKAVEQERINALMARNTTLHLLAWYVGARNPVQIKLPRASGLESFTTTEQSLIIEARKILSAPEFARIRAAQASGQGLVIRIGGRLIQYEPGAPCSGMTLFGENGFLIGREAFKTEAEVVKTVLHELHRLATSTVRMEGATMATVHSETQAAKVFADRAFRAVVEGLDP
jgi:hypothetical protein